MTELRQVEGPNPLWINVTDLGPFRATVPTPGWAEFWDHYETGKWEPQVISVVREYARHGVFVDVGAWCGPHTLLAASQGARVLALEPDPIAAQSLRLNLAVNDFPRVSVIEKALVTEPGPVHLDPGEGGYGGSQSSIGVEGLAVEGITFDQLLDEHEIGWDALTLVKIDIEGAEREICPFLLPHLAQHRIPACVAVHDGEPPAEWKEGFGRVEASGEGEWVYLP